MPRIGGSRLAGGAGLRAYQAARCHDSTGRLLYFACSLFAVWQGFGGAADINGENVQTSDALRLGDGQSAVG